jgi:hypothetical protein
MVERYITRDEPEGLSVEAVSTMELDEQRDFLRRWFLTHYEDPANETPYESAEGGYIYIWGGPYDAHEVLWENFEGVVPDDIIDAVADPLSQDMPDWAPVYKGEPEHEEQSKENVRDWEDIDDDGEGLARDEVLRILKGAEEALRRIESIPPKHGAIGHNKPPEDIDDALPLTRAEIADVRSALGNLRSQAESPLPDSDAVEASTSKVATAESKVSAWLGDKGDLATSEFVKGFGGEFGKSLGKSLGEWVGPKGIALIAVAAVGVQQAFHLLITAVQNWLPFIKPF